MDKITHDPKAVELVGKIETAYLAWERGNCLHTSPPKISCWECLQDILRAQVVPVGVVQPLVDVLRKEHSPFRHDYVKDEKECSACQVLATYDNWKRATEIKKIESRNAAW